MDKFGRASLLRKLPAGTGIFDWQVYPISPTEEMKAFYEAHGSMVARVQFVPLHLARTLAKIGHAYAVAILGYDGFVPLRENLDAILMRTNDVAYTVGSDMGLKEPIRGEGHILDVTVAVESTQFGSLYSPGRVLVVANIRLFAYMPTPEFHVVVGNLDPQNPQHVATLNEHLANEGAIVPPKGLV
jgi:hypothetical protein